MERIAAFIKRIALLSMSTPPNASLSCLAKIQDSLQKFPRLDSLLDEDGRVATGIYDPFLDDPNMCNPFATNLWELVPLSVSFDI
jgi:nucleolar complex protein 3